MIAAPSTQSPPILIAAASVITEHGIEGASIERIAAASGLSRATLYRRHGGREAIIGAVLRSAAMPLVEAARRAALEHEDFLEGFLASFVRAIDGLPGYPLLVRCFIDQLSEHNLQIFRPVVRELIVGALGQPFHIGQGDEADEMYDWLARAFLDIAARSPWDPAELERHARAFVLPVVAAHYHRIVTDGRVNLLARLRDIEGLAHQLLAECAALSRLAAS